MKSSTGSSKPALADFEFTYNPLALVETRKIHEYTSGSFRQTLDYQYHLHDWLTDINDISSTGEPFAAHYDYYPDGNIQSAEFYNAGSPIEQKYKYDFTYDPSKQLLSADYSYDASGWQSAAQFDVSQLDYDPNGNILTLVRKDSGAATVDSLTYNYGAGNEIEYDANGNFLTVTEGAVTRNYTYYDGSNKVQNTDGSGSDYVYDAVGNVTASTPRNLSGLTYDAFTNMTSGISEGGNTLGFGYGGANQRVLKSYDDQTDVTETLYLHGNNDTPLLEKTRHNLENEISVVYIYGPTGLIAMHSDELFFVIKDHLGSVRMVVDSTHSVRSYYDYTAFGNVFRSGINEPSRYQYTGQEYDDEIGLHNYHTRFYDSDIVDPDGEIVDVCIRRDRA